MTPPDLRFSTTENLSRTTVEEWVHQKNLAMLDEWFTHGVPHKRLADEAFGFAVRQNWLAGAQRVWATGWAPKSTLLATGWYNVSHFQGWHRDNRATTVETWLEGLTWGATDDKDLIKAQRMAQIEALERAGKINNNLRWDRFFEHGVDLSVGSGQEMLNDLLQERFALREPKPEKWPTVERCALLDHRLEGFLSLPDAKRAPLNADALVRLLWRAQEPEPHDLTPGSREHEGMSGAWACLQRLLGQKKPGIPVKARALMACEMGIVGRKVNHPQERMDLVLDALIRWGLPESVTFTQDEMAYNGAFYGLASRKSGYVTPQVPSRYNIADWAARYTDRIDEQHPTLYVGDHWFRQDPAQRREWDTPMTVADQTRCRGALTVRMETPILTKIAQKSSRSSKVMPSSVERNRL